MEKMMKMKEAGNYFMRANRPAGKPKGYVNQMAQSDPELPRINNKANQQAQNQKFHSLTPTGNTTNTNYNNNQNQQQQQIYYNNNNNHNAQQNQNQNSNTHYNNGLATSNQSFY